MTYYEPKSMAIVGMLSSCGASLMMPLFGYVLSQFIFIILGSDAEDFRSKRDTWSVIFALLCLGIGVSTFIQKICFAIGGENLTYNLRVKLFKALLHKSIGWFDLKTHSPGTVTNILAEEIGSLNGLTTESVSIIVEASLSLLFSCFLCFLFAWQIAVVVTLSSPFMVMGGLGMASLQFNMKEADDSNLNANAFLNDIILNYRTVITLGHKNVEYILTRYDELLEGPYRTTVKQVHLSGVFFAYSQSIRFLYIAFVFYIAAVFSTKYSINKQSAFTACYIVFVGAIGSGVSLSFMPSISKARKSASRIW